MSSRRLKAGVAVVAGILFAGAPAAEASIKVAANARSPALRVNVLGFAEVSWSTKSGERRYAVVDPAGLVHYNQTLLGPDVSVPAAGLRLPVARTVRQTPDGARWALQSWRRLKRGPVELRFSRWRGEPTKLTLAARCCKWRSERISGYATFQGAPIFGYAYTATGVPLDKFGRNVYLDAFQRGRWKRMMGILTHRPTGFYRLWIRRHWRGSRYRGTIIGPNLAWVLAPDARATTRSVLR